MRLWDRNLPGEVIWQFSNEFTYAPGSFQCSSCTQKDRKRRKVVVISVGLVAGESLPLTQSSATEIGICTGNYPGCLPGRCEIFCGPRDCP